MHLQRAASLQAMCKETKPVAGWQGTAGTWENLGVVFFFLEGDNYGIGRVSCRGYVKAGFNGLL